MGNYPYLSKVDEKDIAYIRVVDPKTLPDEMRQVTQGMDTVYSIHNAEGALLAFVDDRRKAFALARVNDMHLVSVN